MRLVDDLGFDSLMINDLATGLADAFPGLGGIPQELLINRPSVQDLIDFVGRSRGQGGAATDREAQPAAEPGADLVPDERIEQWPQQERRSPWAAPLPVQEVLPADRDGGIEQAAFQCGLAVELGMDTGIDALEYPRHRHH